MTQLRILLVMLISVSVSAQTDKITKELGDFTKLKAFDGIAINLIKSDVNRAVITGATADKVSIVNKDGNLKIRMDIDKVFSGFRTFIDLYYTNELMVLDVNEDARIASKEILSQKVIELKAQEGGEIDLGVSTEQLLIKSVTGGEITVSGRTTNQDININTGGRYYGKEVESKLTTVVVNAGGLSEINTTDYVKATVKAGGKVAVYGNPAKMDEKTVFGGKITRM